MDPEKVGDPGADDQLLFNFVSFSGVDIPIAIFMEEAISLLDNNSDF